MPGDSRARVSGGIISASTSSRRTQRKSDVTDSPRGPPIPRPHVAARRLSRGESFAAGIRLAAHARAVNQGDHRTRRNTHAISSGPPVTTIDVRRLAGEPAPNAKSALQEQLDAPLMLTVQESAKILRVNEKTIYDMVAKGELPGVKKVGRSIRISRRVLMQWLSL